MSKFHRLTLSKVSELKTFTADEVRAMGSMCAWDGCGANYDATPDGQPPDGWRILYTLRHYDGDVFPGPKTIENCGAKIWSDKSGLERDCVLCPEHAEQLDRVCLKPLHRELMGKTQGAA